MSTRLIISSVVAFMLLIGLAISNPWSWNDAGNRTVVEQAGGKQFVEFNPGIFYAGFFAKETEWPNQISVMYNDSVPDLDLVDNGIQVGMIKIMFNDGTTADVKGIAQFVLPSDETDMILIHNTHRTPQSLVTKRLATFTKECLQSSAQSMSSDKHYGGGRAQMSQDYLDQLRNGVYISETKEVITYDSVEKERKRLYLTSIKRKKDGTPERKVSAIEEYSISVADASIIDTDYADVVDQKLNKIIEASTATALSKQNLMKAQQEALTKKAEGEKELVKIEYEQRQDQTKQVVSAQTRVAVAEQDKLQQKIAYEAAIYQSKKVKELAEGEAYAKKAVMVADGALTQRLEALKYIEEKKWDAVGRYQGNWTPSVQSGNGGTNNGLNYLEIMSMQAAKQLGVDMNFNKNK